MQVLKDKRVLVAALDWGLGHATRCVPIIRRLQNNGYEVILASSGSAKKFFNVYFPELLVIDKPGYNITYPMNQSMTLTLLWQGPSIIKAILKEHFWLKKIIRQYKISEVISDNCYGLWNNQIHSVFITHQLRVKCPPRLKSLESFIQNIVNFFINKYDECYVPDTKDGPCYSGSLSRTFNIPAKVRFIGTLSRFSDNKSELESESFDVVVLLSGPEPQRTIFENQCEKLLKGQNKKCCIIRGLPGNTEKKDDSDEIIWHNHLPDDELKAVLKYSKKVICRSGYSTIMDLVELNVKAMLVPTPGQTEQEYLADHNNNNYNYQFEKLNQHQLNFKDMIREVNRPSIIQINQTHQLDQFIDCFFSDDNKDEKFE